ncbi:D-ribose ABC transporter substrate-binding protein [Halomonas sp. hl-4]|uniref:D-ribose ABC transporter substrate-binding protein n=1 Tax=Halomonas sp. hl-4 TaxID=1761789 RepID=UPI000BB7F4DE|nr:D-ribose ABC transporter substrate-binding protein [Halomonas sp. hl-4]SNY96980.1 monosaccharide ABC transporter substrate-binding protein, CUT2 family [Halomonas sp. hl-4]
MQLNRKKIAFLALSGLSLVFSGSLSAEDKGLISIIVNDMSNPYWKTEGGIAESTAEELGYSVSLSSHVGDTNTESNQIDTAITNNAKAIILDPANADGSVGAVQKAVEADIPVFIINSEINEKGLAKAQLVSNNAQGAALGAQEWAEQLGGEGRYIELQGPPSDNNAATRSNGYETVLSQYPDIRREASDVANWDRTEGRNKMQSMLRDNSDINGVISGNDEMALGAISALKQEDMLDDVIVGGFDGSPDAVDAVRSGEVAYTVLQPVAIFAEDAVDIADQYINTGETGLDSEKKLYDCILITADNVDDYTSPFVLEE